MRLSIRSEEHTSELQSHDNLVCRLLLEKKKTNGAGRHPCASGRPASTHPVRGLRTAAISARGSSRSSVSWCSASACFSFFFFLMVRGPPKSTLFPHPTLFRF